MGQQISLIILNFISRTIFIRILGAEYLGISGLFANILTILSLAELGVGTAIIYALYKPLFEKNYAHLSALMNYYKILYRMIAIVVAVIGIALIPFLGMMVNVKKPIPNIEIYYLVFLSNSVVSYLVSYKAAIINADQKMYITKIYLFIFTVIQFVLQTLLLLITHNYIVYIIVQVLCTFLYNVFVSKKADRMYPWLNDKNTLPKDEKIDMFKNIKSMFLYRLGGVLFGGTDNVMISIMVGTIWVGYYSNYNMIIISITGFISVLFTSLYGSIGNLNAGDDTQKKYEVFDVLLFISFWIGGFCSICFFVLFNDFITLWLGNKFLLDVPTVFAIILNFYLATLLNPLWSYRETTGLFRKTKYVMLFTSTINLGLSILLGFYFGIFGILMATVISRLATYFWYEPFVLYRDYFKKPVKIYFFKQVMYFGLMLVAGGITYFSTSLLPSSITIPYFILKLVLCMVIPNALFFMIFHKTKQFAYLYSNFLGKLLNRMKK